MASALALSPSDRRGSARSRLFMLVRARGDEAPMWAWDVGLGGMQCRSRTVRWPGTYLDLRFRLPETSEWLEVGAQVVSIDRSGKGEVSLGLRFCATSPKVQLAIYRFLDNRRRLWDESGAAPSAASRYYVELLAKERPFDALIADAEQSLRRKTTPWQRLLRFAAPALAQ